MWRPIAGALASLLLLGVLIPCGVLAEPLSDGPRSDATSPPPPNVSGLETPLDPGWLIVQCYCWRGEGVAQPTINLREERGDWSYSWTPDLGQPTIFTDLPTDVGLIVELADKSGIEAGQPSRWDGIYLGERGAVIYFIVNPT